MKHYDKRNWRKLSRLKLSTDPLCEACSKTGRIVPAVLVHHIEPIEDGGALYPTLAGLMSVCRACHNRIHSNMGMRGCDVHGLPLDPSHSFFDVGHTTLKD